MVLASQTGETALMTAMEEGHTEVAITIRVSDQHLAVHALCTAACEHQCTHHGTRIGMFERHGVWNLSARCCAVLRMLSRTDGGVSCLRGSRCAHGFRFLRHQRLWREIKHIMKIAQTVDGIQGSMEKLAEGVYSPP